AVVGEAADERIDRRARRVARRRDAPGVRERLALRAGRGRRFGLCALVELDQLALPRLALLGAAVQRRERVVGILGRRRGACLVGGALLHLVAERAQRL